VNLRELLRIWRRRPILTAALLTVAAAGVTAAVMSLPPTYQSNSSVVLLASRSVARLYGGNPYMSFSSSLTLTGDVLSRELMAPATVSDLAARGITDPYMVALAPYNTVTTGSVLLVTVTGSEKSAVETALDAVTHQINVELFRMQAKVSPHDRIRAAMLSFTPEATLSVSQTARPLVLAGAAVLLLALGIPVIVDGRAARRRLRDAALLAERRPRPADQMAYQTLRG
jgi:hypothetical protein